MLKNNLALNGIGKLLWKTLHDLKGPKSLKPCNFVQSLIEYYFRYLQVTAVWRNADLESGNLGQGGGSIPDAALHIQ